MYACMLQRKRSRRYRSAQMCPSASAESDPEVQSQIPNCSWSTLLLIKKLGWFDSLADSSRLLFDRTVINGNCIKMLYSCSSSGLRFQGNRAQRQPFCQAHTSTRWSQAAQGEEEGRCVSLLWTVRAKMASTENRADKRAIWQKKCYWIVHNDLNWKAIISNL